MIISKTNKLYIIYLFTVGWLIIILHVYFRFLKPRDTYSLAADRLLERARFWT